MNISKNAVPPQALRLITGPAKVTTYESTGGQVTQQFAQHNLGLIPSIGAGSIIHDNASGSGTVTRLILSNPTTPKDSVQIQATDIDQPFLDQLSADAASNAWPVTATNQRGESLSFADETFTHSITNIGIIFFTGAGLDGTKEIHRTLKPGGVAIVNCWESVTWQPAIFAVHAHFRSKHPFPAPTTNWKDGKQIRKVMIDAGFAEEKMKVETSEAWAKVGGGEDGFRAWVEKTWAYLAGIAGWFPDDERDWDEEVDMLAKVLRSYGEEQGVKVVGDEVWLRASQWVVVAEK
ncbi:hypothetical protein DM02DRAFT_613591 [Periconia macrospinosa]|uniref:Methyltransferase domain-containing protein n=1 Tax=Periconia macrospinosa TaxID=97972 RepID=A0A2V1DTH0_9PLEO|nr:hypothetical protein DM02DRAFT_613591 [Periconia macrospinosa]